MHPYRMWQLIKERGQDDVVNVRQRTSLYQTIDRLLRAGMISAREHVRDENRPERTVYEISEDGRSAVVEWMRTMLATPDRAFPEFPAALACLPLLTPADARKQLERRVGAIESEIARIDSQMKLAPPSLPRLFVLETEYARAMLKCELDWVRSVTKDLAAGRLAWNKRWLRQVASQLTEEMINSSNAITG